MEKMNFKNKMQILITNLYTKNLTIIVTLCWIITSFHLTILFKYETCINCYDEKNTISYIFGMALGVIFIVYLLVISFFYINKDKIGKEKIIDIEEKNRAASFSNPNPKVFILPMYLLWIFSLSKLIVIFNEGIVEENIIKIIILLIIFIGSFLAWFCFKKTSTNKWSFWITLFSISYVLLNIYWDYFLPFLESYLRTLNCVFTSIISI